MCLVGPRPNELATRHALRHHKLLLILLSRIDGDAPRAQTISAGRLDGSRAGLFHI